MLTLLVCYQHFIFYLQSKSIIRKIDYQYHLPSLFIMLSLVNKQISHLTVNETLVCHKIGGETESYSLLKVTKLEINHNFLRDLPNFPNSLQELYCANNLFLKLSSLLKSLKVLDCTGNYLQKLSLLPETLERFYCSNNQLQSLPVLPNTLEVLHCYGNQLQNLPILPETLEILYCNNNHLLSLPPFPKALKELCCGNNGLQTLPELPKTLEKLYCGSNQLQTLPFLPEALYRFNCLNNPLIVIRPTYRPPFCYVPESLQRFYSQDNYPNYRKKYETYHYLITYLTLCSVSPVILFNEAWLFPGII